MREFRFKEDSPVLIGRIPTGKLVDHLDSLVGKVPEEFKEQVSEDIKGARYVITMKDCNIGHKPISRAHCIIFPGKKAQISDLFSTNGTIIASPKAGVMLDPGRKTDLMPNDIILLARGMAIFQYLVPGTSAEAGRNEMVKDDMPPDQGEEEVISEEVDNGF
jgi:hypothetical protein